MSDTFGVFFSEGGSRDIASSTPARWVHQKLLADNFLFADFDLCIQHEVQTAFSMCMRRALVHPGYRTATLHH